MIGPKREIDFDWNSINIEAMKLEFTYWEQDEDFLGYLNEFPDYWTQGKDLEDLKEHLRELHGDLSSGQVPGVRRVAELDVA